MTQAPGLASWLQLTLTPGLGAATIRELLGRFGLPENILGAKRADLARVASPETLTALDSAYPRLLLEIADPPALLYCRGRTELLNRPALAVVGSRNATAQGASNAEQFGG